MTATYGPDELLCHHGDDEDGHALDAARPVQVKVGARLGWPAVPTFVKGDPRYGYAYPAGSGTCPECGRTGVKVTAHTVRVIGPAGAFLPLGDGGGPSLGVRPQLAAHKRPGRGGAPCPGAGLAPAETRYHSPAIEAWVHNYGREHVA